MKSIQKLWERGNNGRKPIFVMFSSSCSNSSGLKLMEPGYNVKETSERARSPEEPGSDPEIGEKRQKSECFHAQENSKCYPDPRDPDLTNAVCKAVIAWLFSFSHTPLETGFKKKQV